jgi:hypothetical protein
LPADREAGAQLPYAQLLGCLPQAVEHIEVGCGLVTVGNAVKSDPEALTEGAVTP